MGKIDRAGSKRAGWQNGILPAASLFFYGWWDWRFLFLADRPIPETIKIKIRSSVSRS